MYRHDNLIQSHHPPLSAKLGAWCLIAALGLAGGACDEGGAHTGSLHAQGAAHQDDAGTQRTRTGRPSQIRAIDRRRPVVASKGAREKVAELDLGRVTSDRSCPLAVIHVLEGDEVHVGTTLHLVGSESLPGAHPIGRYRWHVLSPQGTHAPLSPHPNTADPTLRADHPGDYVFTLWVVDEQGLPSCEPAHARVTVIEPPDDLEIEVTWEGHGAIATTAQPDVDLHLRHDLGDGIDTNQDGDADGWFSEPWDCWELNPNPAWDSEDPQAIDDPIWHAPDSLSELIVLPRTPAGRTYRLGVHYGEDQGLGDAAVTVRVFMGGILVLEYAEVTLSPGDFWEIATLQPDRRDLKLLDHQGDFTIISDYQSPFSP